MSRRAYRCGWPADRGPCSTLREIATMKTVNPKDFDAVKEPRLNEGGFPSSEIMHFSEREPLLLDCGQHLAQFSIAYQPYGRLNADKSNAILACHALTGDQHVANTNPVTGKPGWWETMIGPGKPVDTDRFFVICSNVLGGCMGSTGPASINPSTGKPYGLEFPVITVGDMVDAQVRLIDRLVIDQLFSVICRSI